MGSLAPGDLAHQGAPPGALTPEVDEEAALREAVGRHVEVHHGVVGLDAQLLLPEAPAVLEVDEAPARHLRERRITAFTRHRHKAWRL